MKFRHLTRVYILLLISVSQFDISNGGVFRRGPGQTIGVACNNSNGNSPKGCSTSFKPGQNNINIYIGDGTGGGNTAAVVSNSSSANVETETQTVEEDEAANEITSGDLLEADHVHEDMFEVIHSSPISVGVAYANIPEPVITPEVVEVVEPVISPEPVEIENEPEEIFEDENEAESDEDMVIVINEDEVSDTIEEIIQENVVDKPAEDDGSSVIVEIMEAPQSDVVTVVIDDTPQASIEPEVVQAIEEAVQNNLVENPDVSDIMLEVVDTLHPVIIEAFTVQDGDDTGPQVVLAETTPDDNDAQSVDYDDFDDNPLPPNADEGHVQMEVTQGYIIHTPDHHDYLLLDSDDEIDIQPLAEVVIDTMEHSDVVVLEIDPVQNHETDDAPIDAEIAEPLNEDTSPEVTASADVDPSDKDNNATLGNLPISIPTLEELQSETPQKPSAPLLNTPSSHPPPYAPPHVGSGATGFGSGTEQLLAGLGTGSSLKPQLGTGQLTSNAVAALQGITHDQPASLGSNLGWGSEPGSSGLVMDAIQNIGGNAAILSTHMESVELHGNSTNPAVAEIATGSAADFVVFGGILQDSVGDDGVQSTTGNVDGGSSQMHNVATMGQENQVITEGTSEAVGEGTVVQMAQAESAHSEDTLNQELLTNLEPEHLPVLPDTDFDLQLEHEDVADVE